MSYILVSTTRFNRHLNFRKTLETTIKEDVTTEADLYIDKIAIHPDTLFHIEDSDGRPMFAKVPTHQSGYVACYVHVLFLSKKINIDMLREESLRQQWIDQVGWIDLNCNDWSPPDFNEDIDDLLRS